MAEQPNASAKSYNPRDHLVQIRTKEGLKDYYPAAWRLYELNMRYPNANFRSEIIHMDVERNFVIVKCTLYLGNGDPDLASRKTEALKQGLLSQLDKVETAAKARCARDLGISTELALDFEDGEDHDGSMIQVKDAAPPTPVRAVEPSVGGIDTPTPLDITVIKERMNSLYTFAKKLGMCKTDQEFIKYLCKYLGFTSFEMETLTSQHLDSVERDLKAREQKSRAA